MIELINIFRLEEEFVDYRDCLYICWNCVFVFIFGCFVCNYNYMKDCFSSCFLSFSDYNDDYCKWVCLMWKKIFKNIGEGGGDVI